MNKLLKVLGILATVGIMLVILAGVVVTKTGSGDGCGPNWPLCHGQLFPSEPTFETVVEYTHRLVTGIVGIIVFVFTILAAAVYRKHKEVIFVAAAAIFFLLLQSTLGALAVVYGQSSAVMALHFGFSLLSYATLFILLLYVFHLSKDDRLPVGHFSPSVKYGALCLFIFSYIVVYLGALVTHTGSSMGCQGWPLCNGQLIPSDLSGQTVIQYLHRLAAFGLLLAFGWFMYKVRRDYRHNRLLYYTTVSMFWLLVAQIVSGAVVILSNLHLYATIFHAFFISLMFGFLSYIVLYAFRTA
ncbi:cytochrome oxidase assembly [Caldalkalibacillus thermarum TA2.A1]|uniref:Cytochrome oxidase assembly n=1 Tax=Caldalkalibacillus thermarum (strain TA2.A1) TaxID=986075 RepID=F5L369_CALTT|nr:heme A synthase [Caldalkalibacillus thermarum]EGL84212.1 cytochrome oxidase assembly [Caldalkalibacillus thermarum TA2.A1]QZT32829.1 heme A synthase [Caldalkalibacillus thermarum TA2.A1]